MREQPQGEEDDSTVITSGTGDLVAPAGTAVVPTIEGSSSSSDDSSVDADNSC